MIPFLIKMIVTTALKQYKIEKRENCIVLLTSWSCLEDSVSESGTCSSACLAQNKWSREFKNKLSRMGWAGEVAGKWRMIQRRDTKPNKDEQ